MAEPICVLAGDSGTLAKAVVAKFYQLYPVLALGLTPIRLEAVARSDATLLKEFADRMDYGCEWIPPAFCCQCKAPEPCPHDAGSAYLYRVRRS